MPPRKSFGLPACLQSKRREADRGVIQTNSWHLAFPSTACSHWAFGSSRYHLDVRFPGITVLADHLGRKPLLRDGRQTKLLVACWLLVVLYYCITLYQLATELSFYWDDYFIVLGQSRLPLQELLLSGINGNWWPLSSLILLVETKIFHLWYPGYLLVNGAIILMGSLFLALTLKAFLRQSSWLALLIGIVYATSIQATVNATVITPSWPLSTTLALAAAFAFIRLDRPKLMYALLTLSFLAMSGMFIINAALTAGLVLAHEFSAEKASRRSVVRCVTLLFAGIAGTGIGALISSSRSVNELQAPGVSETLAELSIDAVAHSLLGFTFSWTYMPVIPFSFISPDFYTWLCLNFQIFAYYILGFLVVFAATIWLVGFISGDPRVRRIPKTLKVTFALLIPIVSAALTLSTLRSYNPYAPRYGLMWLPASLLIAAISFAYSSGKLKRSLRYILLTLLSVNALLGIVLLSYTLNQAANVDRDRTSLSEQQNQAIRMCEIGRAGLPLEEISPSISSTQLCQFVESLR
jgi:hypothetical protein